MESKKYYWLKLKRDFFKRHDIQIIESMQNGKDYILFYLKLLCESVDHDGNLRFSEEIPYNEEMLSVITNTNIDVVRSAINVFTKLNMMELLDDGTYYMNEVNKMIGSESEWAEKKRLYRQQKNQLSNNEDNVLTMSNKSKSIDIEIDKEIDKDKEIDIKKESIIINNNTKEKKQKHKYGTNEKILLTDTEYLNLINDYGKEYVDFMIEKLDEYVAMNNNKNGYKDFNLVLRRAIREKWFKTDNISFNKTNTNIELDLDTKPDTVNGNTESLQIRAERYFKNLYNTDIDKYYTELEKLKSKNKALADYVIKQVENCGFEVL